MESFFLHYGIASENNPHALSLETFANTAGAIADIIKEIGYLHFPDTEITVHIEGLHEGSFLAKIRPIVKYTKDITDETALQIKSIADEYGIEKKQIGPIILQTISIIIGGISVFVFQQMIAPDKPPSVNINITGDNNTINLTDVISEKAQKDIPNKNIQRNIGKVARTIAADENVTTFGFSETPNKPIISIPREKFIEYHHKLEREEAKQNPEQETVEFLTVTLRLHAVLLDKDTKKWSFYMGDEKIAASMKDDNFYQRIENNEIVFGHGDTILAKIKRITTYNPNTGKINKNGVRYEVIEVIKDPEKSQENLFESKYRNDFLG